VRTLILVLTLVIALGACAPPPQPPDPHEQLVARGRDLFFNETFEGNGRTCGTCHPAQNNLTIDPEFIATLPGDDPLFVAETNPALSRNFENPRLMREFGLILENLDGFDDLENRFVMRGVPHTLGLGLTIDSPDGSRTGWSGDGAPGDGTLRSFAVGAVIQHFTKRLDRVAGVDFRLPTDDELDALEAFQRSLGRSSELELPLPLRGTVARAGQEIFLDDELGKCNICHRNAGATAAFRGAELGNANFNTGVEDLPDQPARLTGELVPRDDGLGSPGDSTFNVPPLVEAADTGPFFHNNTVRTLESAVAFYDGESFNNSPSGRFLASVDPDSAGIELDATQIDAIAGFLRVLNALENIREASGVLNAVAEGSARGTRSQRAALEQARAEAKDAFDTLSGAKLHPKASAAIEESIALIDRAIRRHDGRRLALEAVLRLEEARGDLVETR
jgi:hypothetical protein